MLKNGEYKCLGCGKTKSMDAFHPSCIRRRYHRCKECLSKIQKVERRKPKRFINNMFLRQKHSRYSVEYTFEEFYNWLMNDSIFPSLYDNWVERDYLSDITPSIIRKNPHESFNLKNIEVGTKVVLRNNKPSPGIKVVIQMDKKSGKEIARFPNAKRAAEMVGIRYYSNIHEACKGLKKTAGGYKWKFAK